MVKKVGDRRCKKRVERAKSGDEEGGWMRRKVETHRGMAMRMKRMETRRHPLITSPSIFCNILRKYYVVGA